MRTIPSLVEASKRVGIPTYCTVELLASCNLKCPHCYVTHTRPANLTLEVLTDFFDQLAQLGTFGMTFTGGEIGLCGDLFQVIAAARRRYFAVHLLSNGTRWGPEEWDQIAELGVVGVRITLYAVTASVHDAITQAPGSCERTMATVNGLLERGVEVALSVPVMKRNVNHVSEVLGLAELRGLSVVVDANIICTDAGDRAPKATMASFEELERMWADPIVKRWARRRVPEKACIAHETTRRPCGVGEFGCFIKCTGEVLPCVSWPYSAGSILAQRFIDVWQRSPVFAQARSITNASLGPCVSCDVRAFCTPCAASNLQENGSLGKPSESRCLTTRAFVSGRNRPLQSTRPEYGPEKRHDSVSSTK